MLALLGIIKTGLSQIRKVCAVNKMFHWNVVT